MIAVMGKIYKEKIEQQADHKRFELQHTSRIKIE